MSILFADLKHLLKKYFIREKVTVVNVPVVSGQLLEGKVALIIGASGDIGSCISKKFANHGAKVIVSGRNEEKLKTLAKDIGEKAQYIQLDVLNVSDIRVKICEAAQLFGTIDILVNTSGVHCHDSFGQMTEDSWDQVMDTNLKGVYFSSQETASYMIRNKIKGHILNIASASCVKPGWTPYEISKWGVRAMTMGFADKLISYGIVVNSIAPGPVSTAMLGRAVDDVTCPENPTGRMATPDEIANWAVMMVSSAGDLAVGSTFFISGGTGVIDLGKRTL